MGAVWIIVIIIIALLLFGTIRGNYIQKNGRFEVVSPTGIILKEGSYQECQEFAELSNSILGDIAKDYLGLKRYATVRKKS
ncbi:MAG: hypothetical protein ABJB11_08870 [Ferruginibacter sp.]